MRLPSTRVLKNRINRDLDNSSAAVQISGLRRTPQGYVYDLPVDPFDELSDAELRTVRRIVRRYCGKVA